MSHGCDGSWLPEDIAGVVIELTLDRESPYWTDMHTYVLSLTGKYAASLQFTIDDPEDLAQDVLVKLLSPGVLDAFRNCHSPHPRASFLAYVGVITYHIFIERYHYHQARARTVPLLSQVDGEPDGPSPPANDPADPRADVSAQVERTLLLEAVFARLDDLATRNSREIVMRFLLGAVYGVPQKFIARLLGCKPGNVSQAIWVIRGALADLLDEESASQAAANAAGASTSPAASATRGKKPRRTRTARPASGKPSGASSTESTPADQTESAADTPGAQPSPPPLLPPRASTSHSASAEPSTPSPSTPPPPPAAQSQRTTPIESPPATSSPRRRQRKRVRVDKSPRPPSKSDEGE